MKLLIRLLPAVLLSACALSRPALERQSFLVKPEHQAVEAAMPVAGTLRVGRVDIAPPFDGPAFIYRRDQVRYETDFYSEFAADPADMVAEAAAEWFRGSGLFREILASRAGSFADYRLEAAISALYIDFRGAVPEAVLAVRWRLLRDRDAEFLFGLDDEERVPLPERSPHGAALAYGTALKQALAKLENVLQTKKLS